MHLPEDVRTIIETLEARGFEAYAVGGCVRDLFLGRVPQDFDITTSAKPEEVKACFRRTVDTGIKHGTVTVMFGRKGYEVTTFRIDGNYSDARHPESVTFTPDLSEDLRRRDFTINAMAYSEKRGVIDLFGGREDLERGIVRAVGIPEERFHEDALRILRCIRFAAQLGFTIDPATYDAAGRLSFNLKLISRERVREELLKILLSDHPAYLGKLVEIGAMQDILPCYPREDGRLARLLNALPKDRCLRLAALFVCAEADCRTAAELAEASCEQLRFDRMTIRKTAHIVRNCDIPLSGEPVTLRRSVCRVSKEAFPDMLTFLRGVQTADGNTEGLQTLDEMERGFRSILDAGQCTSLKELEIGGRDLMAAGVSPGPEVGETLDYLLDTVLERPEENKREILLELVREKLQAESRKSV